MRALSSGCRVRRKTCGETQVLFIPVEISNSDKTHARNKVLFIQYVYSTSQVKSSSYFLVHFPLFEKLAFFAYKMRSLLLLLLLTIGKAAPVPRDELRRLEDKAAAHAHEVAKAAAHAHEVKVDGHSHEEKGTNHTHAEDKAAAHAHEVAKAAAHALREVEKAATHAHGGKADGQELRRLQDSPHDKSAVLAHEVKGDGHAHDENADDHAHEVDKSAAHAHFETHDRLAAKAAAHAHELDKAAHHAAQEAHIHEENANTHTHEVKQGRE